MIHPTTTTTSTSTSTSTSTAYTETVGTDGGAAGAPRQLPLAHTRSNSLDLVRCVIIITRRLLGRSAGCQHYGRDRTVHQSRPFSKRRTAATPPLPMPMPDAATQLLVV